MVRLGVRDCCSQAQLDGFKSRTLRFEAPTQRHLYITEWCAIDVVGEHSEPMLVFEAAIPSFDVNATQKASFGGSKFKTVAMAVGSTYVSTVAVAAALTLVQVQAATAPMPTVWLLTMGVQVGRLWWRCATPWEGPRVLAKQPNAVL